MVFYQLSKHEETVVIRGGGGAWEAIHVQFNLFQVQRIF